jgi:hypothetical protein
MLLRWLLPGVLFSALVLAGDPPGKDEWKLDVVYRKKGDPLRGLVTEQTPKGVKIRCISRKPGSATLVFPATTIPRAEVSRLALLTDEDRKLLSERIETLKREREMLAENLSALNPRSRAVPSDVLDFRPASWPGNDKVKALSYQSTYFKLIATTRPELAQLAVIYLEQIYDAYSRALPSRTRSATPTTILLTSSLAEYQRLAKDRGLKLFNPAFYDPSRNQVVCGSDLERLRDELEKVRAHHLKLRESMKTRKGELMKIYRDRVPAELLSPMIDAEKRIGSTEKRNEETFKSVREALFRRLYHESFHAYLATFVYPPREGALPLWFNEGLAQIFESAIVEVGELRVGHADPSRLTAVRLALARGTLLPLVDLLRSGPGQFQVAHASDQQLSDRSYLAAWALAFHLTFEQRVLGTQALDDYVRALGRGTDPLLAFRDLVGKPLDQFEKEHRAFLGRLKPDGPPK